MTHSPLRGLAASQFAAGGLAAFVGLASSFAVIIRGLIAVGASPGQAASGLMALSIGMGVCGIWLSLRTRLPISIAWSTPGAALLASTAPVAGGFGAAVGAFAVTGALIVLAGMWKPLGRLVAMIPSSLANAMLAGVLLGLCLAPARAVAQTPLLGLAVVVAWAVVGRVRRLLAVPAAVLVAAVLIATGMPAVSVPLWTAPHLVVPVLTVPALIGIALPLFIVTMASQNIPGLAVLAANGYHPDPGPLLRSTGIGTILIAPFGAHAINLAAITASLCAGPDSHPDPAQRYWAAVITGVLYVVCGLFAGTATAFIGAAPPVLIEAVAGLALLGTFAAALMGAVQDPKDREAAVITFIVSASGLAFLGVGAAFWGLLAGGAMRLLSRHRA